MAKLRLSSIARIPLAALALLFATALSAEPARGPSWEVYQNDNVNELLRLAESGDSGAQFQLGTKYLAGRRIGKDVAEGLRWLRASADQGFTRAQVHLGSYYADVAGDDGAALTWLRRAAEKPSERDGVIAARKAGVILSREPATEAEAARYFRAAADERDLAAQVLLGTLYVEGRGVAKDFAEGLKRIERVAATGYRPAKYVPAFIYAEGLGTPPVPREAATRLFGPDSARTEADAMFAIGVFYQRGFWVEKDDASIIAWMLARTGMSADAIRKYFDRQRVSSDYQWADPARALAWFRKAAETGHIGALVNVAVIHFDFKGRHWDCAEGMKWMRRAADQGDPKAQFNIGWAYREGPDRSAMRIGITMENIPEGVRVESVDAGSAAARAGLRTGDRIISVNGTSLHVFGLEDVEAIVESGRKMALMVKRAGEDTAQSIDIVPEKVALKCPGAEAAGLRQDPVEAFRWFERAAEGGNASGLFFLAEAYREGKGTARDAAKAMELYRRGADRGDWQAAQAIFLMYAGGDGVAENKQLAEEWFQRALRLRHQAVGRN